MLLRNLREKTRYRKKNNEGTTSATTVEKVDIIPLVAPPKSQCMREDCTMPRKLQWKRCQERRNREKRIPGSRKSMGTPGEEN
jgi:hypothetical protein